MFLKIEMYTSNGRASFFIDCECKGTIIICYITHYFHCQILRNFCDISG